jgi:beta-galactosidase
MLETVLGSELPRTVTRLAHIVYGGDYNPEQWPSEVWHEDARLMQQTGVNLVSLGVFAWSRLEPQPGQYDFAWLDEVMDLLEDHGVAVNLATATAAPPPWLVRMHPEMLPIGVDGTRLWHGSRQHYCPHSPVYRAYAARLARQLAERYATHPALALWHVDNEYGCHISECFCDVAAAAFRNWLQARYSKLDALNAAWGTAFWSQIYCDWAEIEPPRPTPYTPNPAQQLDWRRFNSDALLACYQEQRAILKELTPEIPVTTNFMGFFKPLDYWAWAAHVDVIANDCYPDPSDPQAPQEAAMTHDLMRSLRGGQAWMLMEQATSHVNWRAQNASKAPGQMRCWSYQAIARGADAVMFFQWRASQAGAEKFHSAMLPHAGTSTRVWGEVRALGAELAGLDALLTSQIPAQVGVLLDWESWWALELEGKPAQQLQLLDEIRAYYRPLYARNIAVNFVHPAADLSNYRLLLAPNLYLVRDAAAHNIERFVADGGTIVISWLSGIVDEHEQVRLGGYPAPFRRMLGAWVEEFAPLGTGQCNNVATLDGQRFAAQRWAEIVRLEGAEALAHFAQDFFADQPAVTRNSFGAGTAYYVGTALDADGMDWLTAIAVTQAHVKAAFDAPPGVEVVQRVAGAQSWLFVLNHRNDSVEIPLPTPMYNLLSDSSATVLQLAARAVAILT